MTLQLTQRPSILPEHAIAELEDRFAGEIVRAGDDDYDRARRVWNAAFERRPVLVARPGDTAAVIAAVNFARVHDLPLAVRSGGHSVAGQGTVDDGLVIDLSAMKQATIDPERRLAWVELGLTWGELTARTQKHGLAIPAGDMNTVGVGGLTLGGGIGWLTRKYGLTIDNLRAVDVVTAGGDLLTASSEEHPDLFWALRGGGGNFGVATGFQFELRPVGLIVGGAIVYPASRDVLRAYFAAAAAAPDELSTITFVMPAPPHPTIPEAAHGSPVILITACYTGDLEAGARAMLPLQSLAGATPLADMTGVMPYPELFRFTEGGGARRPHIVRQGYQRAVDDETIDLILRHSSRPTSPFTMTEIRVLGGAMARVPTDATAFGHRDLPIFIAAINAWDDWHEPGRDRHLAWATEFWAELAPRTEGAYIKFLSDGEDRVHDAYPPATLARLAAIKRQYDPGNLFRLNVNIQPA